MLIANEDMYNNLKDNQINQFFFDCTYKLVPPNKHNFRLMVLCGYNSHIKKTKLCLFVLLSNEKEETFRVLFSYLKENCSFNPRNIMCDFSMGQILAVKKVFEEVQIHCCFFHFSQAIWHRFKINNLCGIGTYQKNRELLFNIQIMCFMKRDKIDSFYNQLKRKYKENKYKKFFEYFSKNWLGGKYPKNLWNYYDIINNDNSNNITHFHLTNNLCENINRYLNSNLKRGICSNFLFRTSILMVIEQFENKSDNISIENKKSDILKFYIKNCNNPKILNTEEINELYDIYNDVKFVNINKDYIENDEGEADILNYEDDSDSD